MDFLVEFSEHGARIIKDPSLIESKKSQPNVLINPEISHLAGISPSFWVKDGDKVGHMGINESKEAVFSGKIFAPAFDDKIYIPEPIVTNMVKIEKTLLENDAKHTESVQEIYKKIDSCHDVILLIIEDFRDEFQAAQEINRKKFLKLQIAYFICLLSLFLLKFS